MVIIIATHDTGHSKEPDITTAITILDTIITALVMAITIVHITEVMWLMIAHTALNVVPSADTMKLKINVDIVKSSAVTARISADTITATAIAVMITIHTIDGSTITGG
jgi:hypothetical protein